MKRCSTLIIIKTVQIKATVRCYPTSVRMIIIKKTQTVFTKRTPTDNKRWWGHVKKRALTHCWWACELVQPLQKNSGGFLKNRTPHDSAIPLLGIYLKKTKTLIQKDTCTPMFTATLFTIRKQVLLSHKQNEILPCAKTWMNLEGIKLSKISQTEKDKYSMLSLIHRI